MNEYRRDVPLSTDTDYWFVDMGPIPGMPGWHQELYAHGSYPFPTLAAARLFASNHKREHWLRKISIRFPDGHTEEVAE